MVTNSSVPPHEGHIANLAFASVKEYPCIGPAIPIPILMSLFSSKQQYETVLSRSANASLPLAPVKLVQFATLVYLSQNKHYLLLCDHL